MHEDHQIMFWNCFVELLIVWVLICGFIGSGVYSGAKPYFCLALSRGHILHILSSVDNTYLSNAFLMGCFGVQSGLVLLKATS